MKFPWMSRTVNNQKITCTWMSSHKQIVGCNSVFFFWFLLENTGLDIYENNESIPRVVRLEHLNIFGDPNPFESQNTTTHPQDQTPGTIHSNNCNARKAPTRPTSYHFGLNDLTNQ